MGEQGDPRALTVSVDADGTRHLLGEWPGLTAVTPELLGLADPALLETIITVRVSGGEARYRVTNWDKDRRCLVLEYLP